MTAVVTAMWVNFETCRWESPKVLSAGRKVPIRDIAPKGGRTVVESEELEAERVLCDAAKRGDRVALGRLLRKYGPVLYRSVLVTRLGSAEAAQEALAETYARVVERIGQFEWQHCGFYPWFRIVGLRIALDQLRKKRRETLFQPEDLEREVNEYMLAKETKSISEIERKDLEFARQKVNAVLEKLNPRYALAIRARILEEKSRDDVAALLGISVATFDVVLHRAMLSLKKHLETDFSRTSSQVVEETL